MILRRMMGHVKRQDWFAVFLDFVIVVVGVFVGIQVSNWNTAQVPGAVHRRPRCREWGRRMRNPLFDLRIVYAHTTRRARSSPCQS
jgi:hypothetical protein